MGNEIKVPIVLLEDYLKYNQQLYYVWEPSKVPHMAVIGGTGSGKSYFCKILAGKLCLYAPQAELMICDFKGDDSLSWLASNPIWFYQFTDCIEKGLDIFYSRFLDRQNGKDKSRHPLILYFDELAAAVNFYDKKEAEALRKKIANLLMLGRSFNVFLILVMQRPDSAYLPARENICLVVALNNQSVESKEMFFHSFKDKMPPDRKRGTGYMLESGATLNRVVVPTVGNMDKLHQTILDTMLLQAARRSKTESGGLGDTQGQ